MIDPGGLGGGPPGGLAWLVAAAALAGCVDAIGGGGGLIQVPALFGVLPQAAPVSLFAINKASSVWGTAWAAWRYARQVQWGAAAWWLGACAAAGGAAAGAWAATRVPVAAMRVALPVILVALLLYTLARPQLGAKHRPAWRGRAEMWRAGCLGALVGGYDGLFGPGTGSFLMFGCVRWLGYDFLHASACAKLFNAASNVAALAWFAAQGSLSGQAMWQFAVPMALANVAGSTLGTRLALTRGAGFVRSVFVVVVVLLIARTGWDAARLLGWVR